MSDAEMKLAAFWREGRPAASDAAFRLAVLERRARRRFRRDAGWVIFGGVFAVGCLAEISRGLSFAIFPLHMFEAVPVFSVVGTCAIMLWAFMRSRQVF